LTYRLKLCLLVGAICVGCLVAASPAHGGVYGVSTCLTGPGSFNGSWWGANSSPNTTVYAACPADNYAANQTGLVARTNGGPGSYVGYGGGPYAELDAPAGASLHSMRFHGSVGGKVNSPGCWEAGVFVWNGGDFDAAPLKWGLGPCQTAGWGWWYADIDLSGYTKARVGVRCKTGTGCGSHWGGQGGVWMAIRDTTVFVQDWTAPHIQPTHGALHGRGWHRGYEEAWGSFGDNVGIRAISLAVDGHVVAGQNFEEAHWPSWARCDYSRPRPCADLPNAGLGLDTRTLSDGSHHVRLAAQDAAHNFGVHDFWIGVDNTAPARPSAVTVAGGKTWRSNNDFALSWTNPPGQTAPIVRGHWELCPAGGGTCTIGSRAGEPGMDAVDGIQVPGPGDWVARVFVEDEAGNRDETHLSDPVRLRFDPQVDAATWELPDEGDPTRLSVVVADHVSGMAGGDIELRRAGTSGWRTLPTRLAGGRLVSTLPDLELPDGAYELRARARDVAGNERIADRYADGRRAVVVLPVRTATRLRGRAAGPARRVCRGRGRRRSCRSVRSTAAFGGALELPFGGATAVLGTLETYDGRPVAGAPVAVLSRPRKGGSLVQQAGARTDGQGRFSVRLAAGPSRLVEIRYAGDRTIKPAGAGVRLLVPAAATLGASRRLLRNGQSVLFFGSLPGRPLPRGGKLVLLQVLVRGGWRTFAAARTDARGRWRYRYRFQATLGRVVYRFRARVEREEAYPYERGDSRVVAVTVRGR
jgi:hypothetical protein